MNYSETLNFLYSSLPMYQRVGKTAFKKDLTNIILLCEYLGNPQEYFRSIHIAGTNGKGSSAHMIASVLQESGYKTGLYTSPHLKNFTERIRINGEEIPENSVVDFVNLIFNKIEEIKPSFFEITVAMAFWYFKELQIDVAVVEVGLGGRLDSTNILKPMISLITNISLDHTDMLGNTLEEIAFEKAGIIKNNTPVIIGERHELTMKVFQAVALERNAPLILAEDRFRINDGKVEGIKDSFDLEISNWPGFQHINLPGVLAVIESISGSMKNISHSSIEKGLQFYHTNTGLKGRWQVLKINPLTICDTAHNEAGIKVIVDEIRKHSYEQLHIVWGMVMEKDIRAMLSQLPDNAHFYFCRPDIPRGMDANQIYTIATEIGLKGEVAPSVTEAYERANSNAGPNDMIYIGGSTFVVAELKDL